MPVEVFWDNEDHSIVRLDVRGKWTLEELTIGRRDVFSMFDTVDHRVDIICHWADEKSRSHVPSGAINFLRSMQQMPHPRRGTIVSVPNRTDLLARMWSDVISKMFPRVSSAILMADSLDEAHTLLKEQSEKLNHL